MPVWLLKKNRRINDEGERAFITTQSIKKLKKHLKEWPLDSKGWHLADHDKTCDIAQLDEETYKDVPIYTRTEFTDALHESFGFRTDYQIIKKTLMKKIFRITKK